MNQKVSFKTPLSCCKYCGAAFSNDYLQKIFENNGFLICESCGVEIKIERSNKSDIKLSNGLKSSLAVKKKSFFIRLYENIRNKKNPIERVLYDSDFPLIFKENLMIVISRLIYIFIKETLDSVRKNTPQRQISKELLDSTEKKVEPVMHKRINRIYLYDLYKISLKQFENHLKRMQSKIQISNYYNQDFRFFIRWLIKEVYSIFSLSGKPENFPKFERTIYKDLQDFMRRIDNLRSVGVNNVNSKNIQARDPYSTINLIEDLREELQKIVFNKELLNNKRLTDRNLSLCLGQNKNHIVYIKKNCKRNPKFQLSLDLLEEYKRIVITKFEGEFKKIIILIEKYSSLNNLKQNVEHIYNYHPNIKLDYFKNIDTKEKAYWLGFIYADGGLSYQTPKERHIRFFFGLDIKDKDSRDMVYRLANTIGVEGKYVKPCSRGNMLQIKITNNTFGSHLNNHGVIIGKRKSKNIELPEFGNRALNIAFLLGHYDGDGTEGSTVISSGSRKFLEQIKKKYGITYELRYKKRETIIDNKEVKGEVWELALGAKLFNEMMSNYRHSMPRKRRIFETQEEKSERMRQTCINRAKLKITDDFLENLKKLVWEIPLYKIAEKYDIATSRISEICKQYQIDKPPIGYWRKKQ